MDVKPGYKLTDLGSFPGDWLETTLGSFAPFVTSGSRGWAEYYAEQGDLFVRITNMTRASIRLDLEDTKFVRLPTTGHEGARTQLQVGDLLVSVTADIGIVSWVDEAIPRPAYINQHIALVRVPSGDVSSRFIAYFLAHSPSQRRFRAITDQGAKAGINLTTVREIPLVIPPTKVEQEAIATALSDADALIDALEQLAAKKRQLKLGAMQELLTGRKRLPGFIGAWVEKRLGDLGKCHRGVSYNPEADLAVHDLPSTVRLLRSNNVQDASIVLAEVQYVDSSRVSRDQRLRTNDILICMANGSRELVGKAGRFRIDDGYSYTFGAFMAAFRPAEQVTDTAFAFYLFHTEAYRRHISILLAGSSINNLTPTNVEAADVHVPGEKAEQAAIAAILSDMDAEIAALEARIAKAHLVKQGMMQELLTGRKRLV